MAHQISNIRIIREFETAVRAFPGVTRFITIVGAMPDIDMAGGEEYSEIYTCQIGPVLKEDEFVGASSLPSIGRLEPSSLEGAQCVIESSDAQWVESSGQVELRVHVSAAGGAARVQILFSVTILAAG